MLGCISEKKARFNVEQFYKEHPQELAQTCAEKFPPISQYIQGFAITKKDTVIQKTIMVDCPETNNPVNNQKYIPKVPCPESKKIYISSIRVDTLKIENIARIEQYRLEEEQTSKRLFLIEQYLKDYQNIAKDRLYIIVALSTLLGFSVINRFKKII